MRFRENRERGIWNAWKGVRKKQPNFWKNESWSSKNQNLETCDNANRAFTLVFRGRGSGTSPLVWLSSANLTHFVCKTKICHLHRLLPSLRPGAVPVPVPVASPSHTASPTPSVPPRRLTHSFPPIKATRPSSSTVRSWPLPRSLPNDLDLPSVRPLGRKLSELFPCFLFGIVVPFIYDTEASCHNDKSDFSGTWSRLCSRKHNARKKRNLSSERFLLIIRHRFRHPCTG